MLVKRDDQALFRAELYSTRYNVLDSEGQQNSTSETRMDSVWQFVEGETVTEKAP